MSTIQDKKIMVALYQKGFLKSCKLFGTEVRKTLQKSSQSQG